MALTTMELLHRIYEGLQAQNQELSQETDWIMTAHGNLALGAEADSFLDRLLG
jgi:hypothetical protein